MFNVRINYIGPINQTNIKQALETSIQSSFQWLGQHVIFNGEIDVQVRIDETSTGRFSGTGSVHKYIGKINGFDTWEHASITESRTGIDIDPNTPEFFITIDPNSDYLNRLWWDPTPLTLTPGEIPDNKTDAFSVVMHEILHGMGISGWLDWSTGEHIGENQSIWDSHITVENGYAFFTGAHTTEFLGGPVEVRLGGTQGAYHLGNTRTQQPFLESSIMNSYHFIPGKRYLPGELEFSILQDIGWTLTSFIHHVSVESNENENHQITIEDSIEGKIFRGTSKNDLLDGSEGNDKLYGGFGDDVINGGKGNDLLVGDSGNDVLKIGYGFDNVWGGEGNDIFNFYAPGHFVVHDFDTANDLLMFDSEKTGLHTIQDLLAVVTHMEDDEQGATLYFLNDVASITFIGLHSEDLSANMVTFG